MKIIRYEDSAGVVHYGARQDDGNAHRIKGDVYGSYTVTDEPADVHRLLAPVAPTLIACIGMNYRQHAAELGQKEPEYPVLFVKGLGTAQNPDDSIILPRFLQSDEVDYECELAVVIGKACKNVTRETALDYVLGYTCANDVSARDWQIKRGGGQWCRGKFFDTFCPLGPVLVTTDEIPDPQTLGLRTVLNGQQMQNSHTGDMIFSVAEIVAFLSGSSTLLPGTVILTGTPSGVGMARTPPVWLKTGDTVSIEIDRIGTLTNSVEVETV